TGSSSPSSASSWSSRCAPGPGGSSASRSWSRSWGSSAPRRAPASSNGEVAEMVALHELLALVGAAFVLLAGIGVLRLPDLYARMHAATKASTLGIALVGIAAALALEQGSARALLAIVFIFITAPAAAHLVA